jgi:hypothetical protein
MIIEVRREADPRKGASELDTEGDGLDVSKAIEVGAQNVPLEHEAGELAFTHDLDQASSLKFLEVVGEGGWADPVALVQAAARHRSPAGSDVPQHFVTPWLGQSTGDTRELPVGKTIVFSVCHAVNIVEGERISSERRSAASWSSGDGGTKPLETRL